MFKNLVSQKGNVIVTILIAVAVIGVGTTIIVKQASENKKVIKTVSIKKDTEVLEKKLKSYLMNYAICAENFKGKNVNSSYEKIVKNGKDVLKNQTVYLNGSVKVNEIRTSKGTEEGVFNLHFGYQKLSKSQLGGDLILKNFRMKGIIDSNNIVQSCYLDIDDAINAAFEELMNRVCNGPGVIPTTNENRCTVLEFDSTSACSQGQAVKGYYYDSQIHKLRFRCNNVISQVGTNNNECHLGLKATSEPGVFECFSVSDLVAADVTPVEQGSVCKVEAVEGKLRFTCNSSSPSDPYSIYNCNTSTGAWVNTAASCGVANVDCLTGTATDGEALCCASVPLRSCPKTPPTSTNNTYRCNPLTETWSLESSGVSCTTSPNCYSGVITSPQTLCCPTMPTANCKKPACTEGAVQVGGVLSHVSNTKFCSDEKFTGDTWKFRRQKCIGGEWVNFGICWSRTQNICGPDEKIPPSNNAMACDVSDSFPDPCVSGGGGYPDYKKTTTAYGDFQWCLFRMSGGCFIAGSQVQTDESGLMNIEDIKIGDVLVDTDGNKNKVKKLLRVDYKGLIYSINGGEYFFTPNHPLKTVEGWKSLRPDITKLESPELKVTQLKVGDILIRADGLEVIFVLDSKYIEEKVYNFQLDGTKEFIVNEIGVHNKM